jgi:tRNA-dihydrouridine synthase
LLPIFAKHSLDLLTVHGRHVHEMYRSEVHYDFIARAVEAIPCPVLANGNVYSAGKAHDVLQATGARGLMIGRGAIRNPWLFPPDSTAQRGEPVFVPRGHDVLRYLRELFVAVRPAQIADATHVQKMKKYLNYVGVGIEPTGEFLHRMRRATTEMEFFAVCEQFLDHDQPMPLEPYALTLKENRRDVRRTQVGQGRARVQFERFRTARWGQRALPTPSPAPHPDVWAG